jgi:hypothetical protein
MNAVHSEYRPSSSGGREDERQDRSNLQGGWLALARALWIFCFSWVLTNLVYQPPFAFKETSDAIVVGEIGMPLDLDAWITAPLAVLALVFASVVAVIHYWRRSESARSAPEGERA